MGSVVEAMIPNVGSTLEAMLATFLGILALGCLVNWLREWRHDPHGRIFFTALTGVGLLLVAGLVFDLVRRHVSL